jgi:hypothetical protein
VTGTNVEEEFWGRTILGRVVLGLEGPEEGLLSSEDLDGRGGVLGEVEEGTSVGDETSSDELSDEGGKVGGDGGHAVAEILVELGTVLSDGDDLVGEEVDVDEVRLGDLSSHGNSGGGLEGLLELLGEDGGEVGRAVVGAESCSVRLSVSTRGDGGGQLTHGLDDLGVGDVLRNDLGHFGEVPSVPFLEQGQVSPGSMSER